MEAGVVKRPATRLIMKKNTSKSIKSPSPAIKSALTSKPFAANKPVAKAKASVPTAPVPVAPKRMETTITALIDIGFGNSLYIRGEGPGLNWDQGVPLDCLADDKWSITLGESVRPVIFKFLVNDLSWSAGEDYAVAPGTSITVTPVF
jgi:hypothetical protein